MDKYMKAIENLSKKFGSEWIKPAMDAVMEVALQDYFTGELTHDEYGKLCKVYAATLCPEK